MEMTAVGTRVQVDNKRSKFHRQVGVVVGYGEETIAVKLESGKIIHISWFHLKGIILPVPGLS